MKLFVVPFLVLLITASLDGTAQAAKSQIPVNGKYQTVNGVKLYYEEYGKGVPLILIHGGLSSNKDLESMTREFSKFFRVIAVDCPGQGRSEQAESLSYQLMADYFLKMIDQMKLDSAYVFGYSDGGNVALLMGADRPDKVKRVAVFAAASKTSGYYEEMIAGLDVLTPEIVEKDYKWWLDTHLKVTPQKDKWKKFISDFSKMCANPVIVPAAKLREIDTRILFVQGDNDIVKPEHAVELYRSVKGSQLSIIPAASHFILFEKPEVLNQVVYEFFTKEPKLFDWTTLGQ